MPSRLQAILSAIGEPEPSAMEIAEILWLALSIGPTADPASPTQEITSDAAPDYARSDEFQAREPIAPPPGPDDATSQAIDHDEPANAPLHGDEWVALHAEASAMFGHSADGPYQPLLVPAPDALGGRLALQRAIRPLKRRVPSRRSLTLDEEKTVEGIADSLVRGTPRDTASTWKSVLRPNEERWLELAIVVDQSRSMAMWQAHATELYDLMKETGVFSDVRLWHFRVVENRCLIAPFNSRRDLRSPSTLGGSSVRRAILVVSDCTDTIWWRGDAMGMIQSWAQAHPVGLV